MTQPVHDVFTWQIGEFFQCTSQVLHDLLFQLRASSQPHRTVCVAFSSSFWRSLHVRSSTAPVPCWWYLSEKCPVQHVHELENSKTSAFLILGFLQEKKFALQAAPALTKCFQGRSKSGVPKRNARLAEDKKLGKSFRMPEAKISLL